MKEIKFPSKLSPAVNQVIVSTAYLGPDGKYPVNFGIGFNRANTALEFQVNSTVEPLKSRKVVPQMFRFLGNSKFCQAFLQLENEENETTDAKERFSQVKPKAGEHLVSFYSQKLFLTAKPSDTNRQASNSLSVHGWKIMATEDDLNFFLVQRVFYNLQKRKLVIRSAGLMLHTGPAALETLDRYLGMMREIEEKKGLSKSLAIPGAAIFEDDVDFSSSISDKGLTSPPPQAKRTAEEVLSQLPFEDPMDGMFGPR